MWPYRQRILPKGEISTLILAVAEQLICRFVGANSETPVNLSAAIEGEIFGAVEKGEFSKDLFLAAETSVRDTLRFGAYARFLRSDLYRQIQGIFDHFFCIFRKMPILPSFADPYQMIFSACQFGKMSSLDRHDAIFQVRV